MLSQPLPDDFQCSVHVKHPFDPTFVQAGFQFGSGRQTHGLDPVNTVHATPGKHMTSAGDTVFQLPPTAFRRLDLKCLDGRVWYYFWDGTQVQHICSVAVPSHCTGVPRLFLQGFYSDVWIEA